MINDLRLVLVVLVASHARDRETAGAAKLQGVDVAAYEHTLVIWDG